MSLHTGHGTRQGIKTAAGACNNMVADLVLILSGARAKDSGIRGAAISFNEAILVLDNFPGFTVIFTHPCQALFSIRACLIFRVVYTLMGLLHCQIHIYIIHLYSHLLKMKAYMKS